MTRSAGFAARAATIATAAALLVANAPPAGASAWTARLGGGSRSTAAAGSLTPPSPAPVTACVAATSTKAQVTWTAAPHATSYSVWQATDSTGYTVVASGVTGMSWTSGSLPDGYNYYFEISTVSGNWSSSRSAASNRAYMASGNCSS